MKHLKKKLLAFVLSMVMVLGMAMPVLADDTSEEAEVKVSITFKSVTFSGENFNETTGETISTVVDTTTDANLYDTVVTVLDQLGFSESDYAFKTVTDWYDKTKTHKALDSITYNGVTYATDSSHDTSNYYLGAGWTYTGSYGDNWKNNTQYNAYNYLDSNTVSGTTANIDLVYGGYKFSKT